MSTPTEVACKFIPAFFEDLATNPENLSKMYGTESTVMFVDFDCGTKQVSGSDISPSLVQWSHILKDCDLCVESYSAFPLYCGVSVYATLVAETATTRHYFQFITILEQCPTGDYRPMSFYIRNQVIMRPGAVEKEQASAGNLSASGDKVEEEHPQPEVAEVPAAREDTRCSPAGKSESRDRTSPDAASTIPDDKPSAGARPKTWASLAGAALKGEQRPIKVISHQGPAVKAANKPVSPPSKVPAQPDARKQVSPKRGTKAANSSSEPLGDRLMFSIKQKVTDQEIMAALGQYSSRVVSLRNNSANGHVFLDFSGNEGDILEGLKSNTLIIGAGKNRVSIYRQKPRE
uniref:Uncharacterized protein n=1 Tax=Trypanosoma congolense (strain IL3000) TaxID=1068625 RepID=G0UP21_TRYCI|nr:conserved hypothetical protein [Trypanosoma congolense IL3000]